MQPLLPPEQLAERVKKKNEWIEGGGGDREVLVLTGASEATATATSRYEPSGWKRKSSPVPPYQEKE